MAVLDCFAGSAHQSLTQVAAQTGLPLSTTHRIMSALTRGGFLEREGDDAYRVGPNLKSLVPEYTRLTEIVAPHLHALAIGLKRTVTFGIQDGGKVLALHRARVEGEGGTQGNGPSLEDSAIGRVLLAFDPSGLAALSALAPTGTTRRKLAEDLDRIRRRGFAQNEHELAVPVGTSAAIGVQNATTEMIPALKYFADRIFHDVESLLVVEK